MRKTLITIILLTFSLISHTQNIYILNNEKEIYEIDIDNNTSLLITTINYPNSIITDIAVSPSGIFYGIKGNGEIFEINIQDGSINILSSDFAPQANYPGLVCSNDNILYTLSSDFELYKYNITTGDSEFISNLGFNTPGDLTFYKGNLIFKAISTNTIKAYNILNNSITDVFCLLPNDISLLGLTSVFNNCNESRVFGSSYNSIYEFNLNTNEFIDLGINATVVWGMASANENLASACSFEFPYLDCTLSIDEINWYSSKRVTYPNPVKDMLYINAKLNHLSLGIYNIHGQRIKEIIKGDRVISLLELKAGIYFIEIISEFGVKIEKIIKK